MTTIHSDDAVRLAGQLAASLTEDQRVLLFTGTAAGHGVSTVAAEVAVAFARRHPEQVLLVDAQADAPGLHKRFGIPSTPGLIEVLEGVVDPEAAVAQDDAEGLRILPYGRSGADAIGLFGSTSCAELLGLLRRQYRLIVLDTSPLLLSAATALLASQVDGVVAVVASGRTQRSDILELKRVVEGLKVRLLGSVLTTDAATAPRRVGSGRTLVKLQITTGKGAGRHEARRFR